ncbi:MAG: DUF3137 domain-containing protein [Erysipelotrichaceae bacterium]|jgi:hypothetical protein|nr:DUF3137 domain-containing protein [Erysipelotrichaceae bacterium]
MIDQKVLAELEAQRAEVSKKFVNVFLGMGFWLIALLFIPLAAVLFVTGIHIVLPSFVVVLLEVAMVGWLIVNIFRIVKAVRSFKPFKAKFKAELVHKLFEDVYGEVQFEPEQGLDWQQVREGELIAGGDTYSTNDLLKAKYKGVDFCQADIHIQEKHESEKHTTYVTTFLGQYRIFTFPKTFTSYMQIRDKNKRKSNARSPYTKKSLYDNQEKIELENPVFEESFDVYGQSAHDAYYILTPHFMEKLLALREKLNCELNIAFLNKELHMSTLSSKDLFEPNLFAPLDQKALDAIVEEAGLIKDIIDELSLDRNVA